MKIAIIYICTGNYSIFWKNFYESAEQYFYPSINKDYFVFTNDDKLIAELGTLSNVKVYFQQRAGWPYDSMLRFNTFCVVQDALMEYDYCYFWNANTYFVREITTDVIPFPTQEQGLILWRHTWSYECNTSDEFDVEKNPNSSAYIAPHTECHEYGGGFLGGTAKAFITMSQLLRDNIAQDLSHGIIAIWHDQSHVQNYALSHSFIEVPRYILFRGVCLDMRHTALCYFCQQTTLRWNVQTTTDATLVPFQNVFERQCNDTFKASCILNSQDFWTILANKEVLQIDKKEIVY